MSARAGTVHSFAIAGEKGGWPELLESIGIRQSPSSAADLVVLRSVQEPSPELETLVREGAYVVAEGGSALRNFGFRLTGEFVTVRNVVDEHNRRLPIIWASPAVVPRVSPPPGARIFARDRWTGAPLIAGIRLGAGAALWLACDPGPHGYERFPYLLHALTDLGLEPPARARTLWAFFDASYRQRADPEYLARRWRSAGFAALHVAAWHYYDNDPEAARYLEQLIAACHRNALLVYAWLELPHVSEKFWNDHPEWREKTATLQDAQLDWRKLMNLSDERCFEAAASGVRTLLARFDWDGVNLAELYYESLEGAANPARFTPMSDTVRAKIRAALGFDPLTLFEHPQDPAALRTFLEARAGMAAEVEVRWLKELEAARGSKPHLDLVLTHVDDQFDAGMKDAIGVDARRVLSLLDAHRFTFLIEDPATVWHLGPARYQEIGRTYQRLTSRHNQLAIDINIADRYQDVYPTKQQTGGELFELLHAGAFSFSRVALYSENSIPAADLGLLSAAAAPSPTFDRSEPGLTVNCPRPIGIPWRGSALVNGKVWPVQSDSTVWLPAGRHRLQPGPERRLPRVVDLNAELKSASIDAENRISLVYSAQSRGLAIIDGVAKRCSVDGDEGPCRVADSVVHLPAGDHRVVIEME
jgi:hypothetical protein